jgi:hypothetical protein
MRFDGEVALVSGRGIGRRPGRRPGRKALLASLFGERGAWVAGADIDRGRPEGVTALIVKAGGAGADA